MAPKRKCCIPYCNNVEGIGGKQFFKVGSNREQRESWFQTINIKPNSKISSYCCEDHFDLPNDAENYIRCKYVPGTKLRLRNNILPSRKIPSRVCRVCLNIIFADNHFVYISERSPQRIRDIIRVCLPEIDLTITSNSVACIKCFNSLEAFYNTKLKALKTEVAVVKCVKAVIDQSPENMVIINSIDLLEHYNELQNILLEEISAEEPECLDGNRDAKGDEVMEKFESKDNIIPDTLPDEIKLEETPRETHTTNFNDFHQYALAPVAETSHPTSDVNATSFQMVDTASEIISIMEEVDESSVTSVPFGSSENIFIEASTNTIIVEPNNSDQMPVYSIIYTSDVPDQEIDDF